MLNSNEIQSWKIYAISSFLSSLFIVIIAVMIYFIEKKLQLYLNITTAVAIVFYIIMFLWLRLKSEINPFDKVIKTAIALVFVQIFSFTFAPKILESTILFFQ